jgi:hypothetical protein
MNLTKDIVSVKFTPHSGSLRYILTEVDTFTPHYSYTLLEEARKVPSVATSGSISVCGPQYREN